MFLSRYGIAIARDKDYINSVNVGYVEDLPLPDASGGWSRIRILVHFGCNQKFTKIGDLVAFHYGTNAISIKLEDGTTQRIQVNDKLALKVYTGAYILPSTVTFDEFYKQVRTQLSTFNRYVKSGVPMLHTDIFSYSSWKELRDDMSKAELHSSKRATKRLAKADGLKCVISNSKMKVYHVLTYEGACIIGKGTRWCISGTDPKCQLTWNRYSNHSAIFVVVEKHRKTAVVAGWQPDSVKIYNEADEEISIMDMEHVWCADVRQLMQIGGITPPYRAKVIPLRPVAGLGSIEVEPLEDRTARYQIVQSKIRSQSIHRAPPQLVNIEYRDHDFWTPTSPTFIDLPKDFKLTKKIP